MPNIADLFTSVPGLKADYKLDWKEDAKADWRFDWDAVPGDAPGVAPANTVAPVITGTAQDGQTLTVSNGTWTGNPAPTYTYAWAVNGVPQPETGNTYVCKPADIGFNVDATVTATNAVGAVPAAAAPVGPVIA